MNTLPTLSKALILQHASAESVARGQDYYYDGAVIKFVQRNQAIEALVEGNSYEPYAVHIALSSSGVSFADCSCPYDKGGWCKHIVATLLTWIDRQSVPKGEVIPLASQLEPLSREDLIGLILHVVDQHPQIGELFSAPLNPTATIEVAAFAPIDIISFRHQVQSAIQNPFTTTSALGTSTHAFTSLLDYVRATSEADSPDTALVLLDAITDELMKYWHALDGEGDDYEDSWGDDYDYQPGLYDEDTSFFIDIAQLWAELLLRPEISQEMRERWADVLSTWHDEIIDFEIEDLFLPLHVARHGWHEPKIKLALDDKAEPGALAAPAGTPEAAIIAIYLNMLEQTQRFDDAIKLSIAAGRYDKQALLLLKQQRPAAAIAVAHNRFTKASEALSLASALYEQGHTAEAIEVGEYGLSLEAPHDLLGAWLLNSAAAAKQIPLALRAGEISLYSTPNLNIYLRMAELAGSEWPALRQRILAKLRRFNWDQQPGLVDIFLKEGQIDDLIAQIKEHHPAYTRVVEAATTLNPEWAIKQAGRQAQETIELTQVAYYDQAVEWLRYVRAAYTTLNQRDEWIAYIRQLRATHIRKYRLIERIDRFEPKL